MTEQELIELMTGYQTALDEQARKIAFLEKRQIDTEAMLGEIRKQAEEGIEEVLKSGRWGEFNGKYGKDFDGVSKQLKGIHGQDFDPVREVFDEYEGLEQKPENADDLVSSALSNAVQYIDNLKAVLAEEAGINPADATIAVTETGGELIVEVTDGDTTINENGNVSDGITNSDDMLVEQDTEAQKELDDLQKADDALAKSMK